MHWHAEVDVVCIGTGVSSLAKAISVVDIGGEVFVSNAATGDTEAWVASEVARVHPGLCGIVSDQDTNEYFAAITSDLDHQGPPDGEVALPVRVVYGPVSVARSGFVPPFVGSRVRDWAARCLASPSGYLYTRVSGWRSSTLHTRDGDSVDVAEIGSMAPDPDDVVGSVYEWLIWHARQRNIESHRDCFLERLVFEHGDVVGAVFTTPFGALAVRARHGLFLAIGDGRIATAGRQRLVAGDQNLRVSLVGRTASRFGRVELLSSDPMVDTQHSVSWRQDTPLRGNVLERQAFS